jgi:formyltetrahydrofolate deformylase
MNDVNAILLLSCADGKGLVAKISDFIFRHNGNIVHADQHTSKIDKLFFMRIEWELNGFALSREEIPAAFVPLAKQFNMKWDLHFTDYVPRIAIFVSRHLHCLHDLILRRHMGELGADVEAVISNHTDARDLVEQFGMKFFHFPITEKKQRAAGSPGIEYVAGDECRYACSGALHADPRREIS